MPSLAIIESSCESRKSNHINTPIYRYIGSQMSSAPALALSAGLAHASRPVGDAEASSILHQVYGIKGTLTRLGGEKDANFRVNADGGRFLLKIVAGEDPAVCDMHSQALLHLENVDPHLPTQRVVRTREGAADKTVDFGTDDVRFVRLVTFVEGAMQRNTPQTQRQRKNAGAMLARLQVALSGFRHPADGHKLTWDMCHAADLVEPTKRLRDGGALADALEKFRMDVLSRQAQLPFQAVHNDLNSDNIVVDPHDTDRVIGIIDFGDMVRSARVFDLAVGAAYQATAAEDPLSACRDFIEGFALVQPLVPAECDALYSTILARMAQRIAITEIRAELFPENRDYILRNTSLVRRQFDHLARLSPAAAQASLSSTCQTTRTN